MSNLQNPIRVYDNTLTLVGELDDYSSAYFTRSWHGIGDFVIQLNANVTHASDLQKGRIVMFGKDSRRVGIITSIEKKLSERGKGSQIITASGFEIKFIFTWRQVLPSGGSPLYNLTNSAETVMKTLVSDQCGATADADRKFTGLDIATDADQGDTYELAARYAPTVADELQKCSLATGVGYYVYINETSKKYIFDIGIGTDRTAGQSTNPRAIFSDDFDTIRSAEYALSDAQFRNYAFVGGQGVGVDRTVREVYSGASEPTSFERREMFVDARDLSSNATLDVRGAQKLEEQAIQFTISGSPLTYSPLVYRTDYDLGDLVTVDVYDEPYDARITEVKESWAPTKYTIDVVFDKQRADLATQTKKAIESVKSSLNITEGKPTVDFWTIPQMRGTDFHDWFQSSGQATNDYWRKFLAITNLNATYNRIFLSLDYAHTNGTYSAGTISVITTGTDASPSIMIRQQPRSAIDTAVYFQAVRVGAGAYDLYARFPFASDYMSIKLLNSSKGFSPTIEWVTNTTAVSDPGGTQATVVTTITREASKIAPLNSGGYLPANGIAFPASQSASANANTLDDYEEGTWTPALTFGGGNTGITYSNQLGYYTKIGRVVYINMRLVLSNKGSSTGSVLVTSLPFTVLNTPANISCFSSRLANITFSADSCIQGHFLSNTTNLDIGQTTNTGTASVFTDTNFANNSSITLEGYYIV